MREWRDCGGVDVSNGRTGELEQKKKRNSSLRKANGIQNPGLKENRLKIYRSLYCTYTCTSSVIYLNFIYKNNVSAPILRHPW